MKRLMALASALVLLAGGLPAQELTLENLQKEMNAVLSAPSSPLPGRKAPEIDAAKVDSILDRALDLATDHKGDATGLSALQMVLGFCTAGSADKVEMRFTEAMDAVIESWIDSDLVAELVTGPLAYPPKALEKNAKEYFAQIERDSKSEKVKGACAFVHVQNDAGSAVTTEETKKVLARAEALKKQLDKSAPQLAKQLEETIDGLKVIGKPADEIEGADLDGVAFKLSDYRGKVVLLDFWGYW